jgi:thiamine biosynthesis lipoprotein
MVEVRLACAAMRTRFELLLVGADAVRLRAAGEEALAEVAATERELSRFRKEALTARVNREAAHGLVAVPSRFLTVLRTCFEICAASGGAFDPTTNRAGMRRDGSGSVGLDSVLIDAPAGCVRFRHDDVQLDFGGIGKGVALDRVLEVLLDGGVERALLHGGTSTIVALGGPWPIAIPAADSTLAPLWSGELQDEVLSVSADADGHTAASRVQLPRVADTLPLDGDEAARADAWSTAMLVEQSLEFQIRSCA